MASRTSSRGETARTLVLALVFAFGVRTGVAQAYVVEGPSMEPTVVEGQRIAVARCAYGLSLPFVRDALVTWAEPTVGDVVIIESPADGADLVKRVVGASGDTVAIDRGIVLVNGVPFATRDGALCDPDRQIDPSPSCRVAHESAGGRAWLISRSDPEALDSMEPTRVPEGAVFVLGDHRDRSNDSRALGPIPVTRVRGRVLFVE